MSWESRRVKSGEGGGKEDEILRVIQLAETRTKIVVVRKL